MSEKKYTVTTEAGLIVPKDAVTRKERVLPADTFKRIRRLMPLLVKAERIGFTLRCLDCGDVLNLDVADARTISFTCRCSERVVR